ncbi:4'-phosphopantetheinyl transferase family protein [Roseivirga sp.]|uniref:4'-phosphopantetheinyl transferase family protein n=1 Tax=Roseivirga sp. TaxID=1964215 RepID=UPI003B8E02DD
MPILFKKSINDTVSYLVWEISESEDELLSHLNLNDEEWSDFDRIKVGIRRLEWLGARTALKHLVKEIGQFYIFKDGFGKPHLRDSNIGISISHTKGFGAAAINLNGPIGIDIEHPRQQILKIAHKFLHDSEKSWAGKSVEHLTKIWAAKEALYKLHGRTQLTFAEQLIISNVNLDKPAGSIIESNISRTYKLAYNSVLGLELCCSY